MDSNTPEEITEIVASVLDGSLGITSITALHCRVTAMDGLPEMYIRDSEGKLFRFFCESVGEDEFNPFEQLDAE